VNIDFDYYDFPKGKKIKNDVKINLSDLEVKTDASILEKDENNEISEVELSEIVDENINYIYTYASTPPSTDTITSGVFSYNPKDDNGEYTLDESGNKVVYYRLIGENVVESELIDFNQNANPSVLNLYDNVYAGIIPRHLRFANNTEPIIEKGVFAALGLFSNNKLNISNGFNYPNGDFVALKTDLDVSDTKYRGCLTRKKFYSSLNQLTERLMENGVEVVVKEYNAEEDENGRDKNYTQIYPFYNFYFSRALAPDFISRKIADGGMDNLTANDITPFNLSIKEVFKSYYTPAEELYDDFVSELRELFKAINSSMLVNSFVDDEDLGLIKKPIVPTDSSYDAITMQFDGSAESVVDNTPYVYKGITYDKTLWAYYEDNGVNQAMTKDDRKIHQMEYILPDEVNINEIIDALPKIKKQINRVSAIAATSFISMGVGAALMALSLESISNSKDSLKALNTIIKRIRWYQHYTNESVFPSRQFVRDGDDDTDPMGPVLDSAFTYDKRLCRLLVPVYMGTKRKKVRRKNIFGRKRTVYVRVDLGVRWVEVNFVDTNTYEKYRKNDKPLGKNNDVNIAFSLLTANGNSVNVTLSKAIPVNIMNTKPFPETVSFTISNCDNANINGSFSGTIQDSTHIAFTVDTASFAAYTTTTGNLDTIILPFDNSKEPDEPRNITIKYAMPHLPYDGELRKKVFSEFGPFDQGQYANKNRNGDYTLDYGGNIVLNDDIVGWEIFHKSSKSISDLRGGIDIYNKVQFLMQILNNEFGKNRVHLIETTRSFDDQEKLQLGGAVSSFLSWHNYGLAVKIRITEADLVTPILDGSADMKKLLNIAEAFVEGCRLGDYGTSMNVVWCGQLVTGPDIFVWEFLPIGVNHKDALKFRDSAYLQYDPVVANSYVNVTEKGYIATTDTYLTSNDPYILKSNNSLTNGININNEIWVDPNKITNFDIPSNLILKDVKEFLMLVQSKMNANGTDLMGRKLVSEWKANNPKSFNQLVVFNSLIGNYSASRGLLSGDYIDRYSNIVSRYYKTDPIKFVKSYLGDFYYDIKISIDDFSDGSYITLYDGKLTTFILDARSTHREGNGNTFGQKQIDFNSVQFGQYQDGKFVSETDADIITIKTDIAVIDGYDDNGNPQSSDARIIHALIADQLYEEYKKILDNFNNLKIKFLYDSFYNSPNFKQYDLLENEFGVINTQDLLTFPQLRDMFARIDINNKKTDPDGTVKGAGANIEDVEPDSKTSLSESVFEKLVSTSQQVGARKALLTKEKPTIEAIQVSNKIEKTIELLKKNRMPKASDIL
jgi:hypothetical protein